MEMENVTLSMEQFEQLKQEIKEELKAENRRGYNRYLTEVERKHHEELICINGGRTWDTIRAITSYMMGYKYSKDIPLERHEESSKIAETLCIKVIKAFKGEDYDQKKN